MSIYGYCRVSTKHQFIDRQHAKIQAAYPDAQLIDEYFTGTKDTDSRPKWKVLEKKLMKGDTVVFDSVSRMSRNADDGWKTYQSLMGMGVNLVFLREPSINTDVYKDALNRSINIAKTGNVTTDKLFQSIMQALNEYMVDIAQQQIKLVFEQAEKEVKDLQVRTSEGMKASGAPQKIREARTGKTYKTPKQEAAKAVILKHAKDFGGTLNDVDCMKLAGISRNSYYLYKRELKAAQEQREQ